MVAHVKRDIIKQDLSLGSQLTLTALNMRLNWSLSALTICFIFFSLRKTRKRRQFANISILSTIFKIFSKTLSTSFITKWTATVWCCESSSRYKSRRRSHENDQETTANSPSEHFAEATEEKGRERGKREHDCGFNPPETIKSYIKPQWVRNFEYIS